MSARGLREPKIVPLISFCHMASWNRLTLASVWVMGAMPVTTIVPPLPQSSLAPAMSSP
jgi:hypothetical protein